jgi:hypothetical protein
MDLRETVFGGMDWIHPACHRDQSRALVNTVMNFRVPWNAGKFFSSCRTGGFSRTAQLVRFPIVLLRHFQYLYNFLSYRLRLVEYTAGNCFRKAADSYTYKMRARAERKVSWKFHVPFIFVRKEGISDEWKCSSIMRICIKQWLFCMTASVV